MATKTVINANVPQTRGISIVIDPEPRTESDLLQPATIRIYQNTRPQTEPVEMMTTTTATTTRTTNNNNNSNTTMNMKPATTSTTTTTTTTIVREEVSMLLQQVSPIINTKQINETTAATATAAATTRTHIDFNRNNGNAIEENVNNYKKQNNKYYTDNNDDVNDDDDNDIIVRYIADDNDNINNNDGDDDDNVRDDDYAVVGKREIAKETGYTIVTFPHLPQHKAQITHNNNKNNNNNNNSNNNQTNTYNSMTKTSASERGKLYEEMNLAVGKMPTTTTLRDYDGTVVDGICERRRSRCVDSVCVDNDVATATINNNKNKIQIIQCNGKSANSVNSAIGNGHKPNQSNSKSNNDNDYDHDTNNEYDNDNDYDDYNQLRNGNNNEITKRVNGHDIKVERKDIINVDWHDHEDGHTTTTTTPRATATTAATTKITNYCDSNEESHRDRRRCRCCRRRRFNCNDDDDDDNNDDHIGDEHCMCISRNIASDVDLVVGNGENGQVSCDGVCAVYGQEQQQKESKQQQLENICGALDGNSRITKADCASALTETLKRNADQTRTQTLTQTQNSHVVKIQIKPIQVPSDHNTEHQQLQQQQQQQQQHTDGKQITVVTLNDDNNIDNPSTTTTNQYENMVVQKSSGVVTTTSQTSNNNPNINQNNITSGSTTVTELNVSNSPYLYYMMSSGQFSPCDTLDSGTGSDLESNGHHITSHGNAQGGHANLNGGAPKLELHLKTTKIRVNNSNNNNSKNNNNNNNNSSKCVSVCGNDKQNRNGEHQRAGSLTDSEESESSSLSCDSLHSTEYVRQSSSSPIVGIDKNTTTTTASKSKSKIISSLLPDSLLRDIRDRKFPTNDFDVKYGNANANANINVNVNANDNGENNGTATAVDEQDYDRVAVPVTLQVQEHVKFIQEMSANNLNGGKRASLPSKTFVLNTEDGTFVDTKMNSMPRKYEADKYYNFHVNEHENFRSFGNGSGGSNGTGSPDDNASLSEYDTRSMNDDAFAGYKDIRCGSATSTIRSSKGTVRGVKNRVRNGIATFLQLQQPHVKNYMEKDLGKVVLYTTSMGIIRDTYAKCANVKQILRTLLVKFEERDVFMSVEYQQEIKERMHSETIRVPQLFVEGQHIGDAETVERLNESGELRQLLKPYKSISTTFTCQTCGGYRLLPCPSCNGSKKSVHRNHFTAEFVALKCMNCDEVGLVKCHNC